MIRTPIMFKKYQQIFMLIALPLLMSAVVASLVYIPALFQKPKYDFIYSMCDGGSNGYCYGNGYYYDEQKRGVGKYQQNDYSYGSYTPGEYQLYYYSVTTHSSRKISEQEANQFQLQHAVTSPDGFQLKQDINYNTFGSSYNSDNKFALHKGAAKHKTDIIHRGYPDPEVLGWVEK